MWSMTTAAIVFCLRLLLLGLHQSIYNPIIPLRLKDILTALSIFGEDNGIGLSIMQSLILNAIKKLYTVSVNSVFKNSDCYSKMPNMHCLNINQTKFWQFGAIFEDEGIIEGTYGVHKSIYLIQFGLQAPEDLIKTEPVCNDFRD